MSIYSGFATRKDETTYNQLVVKLLKLMQQQCLQLMRVVEPPVEVRSNFVRVISKMMHFEEHKYLPPKFTEVIRPLATVIGVGRVDEIEEKREEE